jgi:UDP-glucose 4-epimerase
VKVAVTGAAGQLGTALLRRLVQEETIEAVLSLDVRAPAIAHPKVHHVDVDVTDPALDRHLAGYDVLIHLAFLVTQKLSPEVYCATNVSGSRNVFEAAAKQKIQHLVYTSSICAYGIVPGHPDPIVEDTPRIYQPGFPYAAAKYAVEAHLDEFEKAHPELIVTRFRPAPALGLHMSPGVSKSLRRRWLLDRGDVPKHWLWDEDVADAIWLAVARRAAGAFVLAPDTPITVREMARIGHFRVLKIPPWAVALALRALGFLRGLGGHASVDSAWVTALNVSLNFSNRRAKTVLGWKPRCPTAADAVLACDRILPEAIAPAIRRFLIWVKFASRAGRVTVSHPGPLSVYVSVTGRQGGDIALSVTRGRVAITTGIPRPPDAVLQLAATDLVALLAPGPGATDLPLTLEEGTPEAKAILVQVLSSYQRACASPGPLEWCARLCPPFLV